MRTLSLFFASIFWLAGGAVATDTEIQGDYLEVRTANVFVGPCIANGEVNLTGKEAILAWRVNEGSWEGTPIAGLSVVAVVRARSTLGDPFAAATDPARSLVLVDHAASQLQKQALLSLARSMAPDLLGHVTSVESAPIELSVDGEQRASLQAGQIASFSTRGFSKGDHLCGNETLLYPPLAAAQAEPAFTIEHQFRGEGLGSHWSSPHRASAFVGSFQR